MVRKRASKSIGKARSKRGINPSSRPIAGASGEWLFRERLRLGMNRDQITDQLKKWGLNVASATVKRSELADLPLPQDWLLPLWALSFQAPNDSSTATSIESSATVEDIVNSMFGDRPESRSQQEGERAVDYFLARARESMSSTGECSDPPPENQPLESASVYEGVKAAVETDNQESGNPPPEPVPVYEGVKVRVQAASTQGAGKPRITRIPVCRLQEDPITERPPLLIGFASDPGGVGCTTLAAHLAYYLAAFKKKNTLACSQDGGLLRFLIPDARLSVDTHWSVAGTSRLAVTYAASIAWDARTRFADLGLPFHPDVIVQDRTLLCMKKPDVVIVPVSDSRSERALSEGRFSRGAVATILVGNQDNRESGAPLLRLQYGGLKESPGIYFVQSPIPDSGLLRRSAELGQTVWELAPTSYTADCMRAAFGEIGQLINNLPPRR